MGDKFRVRGIVGATVAMVALMGAYTQSHAAAPSLASLEGCSRSEASSSKNLETNAAPGNVSAETTSAGELAAGAKLDGKNFRLEITPQGECKAGAECRATVKLEALGEFHINKEYPYKFKAKAEGGDVEFLGTDKNGKNVFSKEAGDFKTEGEQKATMSLKFKPAKAGTITIGGQYKMSVCSAQNCQLESPELALAVTVK